MNERTKKRLIAGMLLAACIISAWLLFITPSDQSRQLRDFAQADSLLHNTLSDFNISNTQISGTEVRVDSTFSRKTYTVSVPPAFSKTQLHAALQHQLNPYGISLPAQVRFPEKDMVIHFYYGDRVFQTVKLVSDKALNMQRSFVHLLAAFREEPPSYLMETLTSFGEPIGPTIILQAPIVWPEWWTDFKKQHPRVSVWPQTDDGENVLTGEQSEVVKILEPVTEAAPKATLLHFFPDRETAASRLGKTSFSYINARDAFILDAEAGRTAFNQTFRALVQQSRNGQTPIGIIIADEESLEWTRQELNTFEKGGLMVTPPQKTNF